MKTIKLNLIIILSFCVLSCKDGIKDKSENSNKNINKIEKKLNMDLNINEIKKQIALQANIETDEEESSNPYNLSTKDLELCLQIVNVALKNNNYLKPTKEIFFKNFSSNRSENKQLEYTVTYNGDCVNWKNDNFFSRFELVDSGHYLISDNKDFFITNFYLLEDLITIKSDNSYELKVPKNIIARNKYLFNDSRADFVWLCFNDEQFLQSLVKKFGYDDDDKLNKFILDKNLKNNEEFGKVIWNKDCLGKIKFNLNIFETIKKALKKEQDKYFETINNYLTYFGNTPDNYLNLTFSDKAEISGKLAYYATNIVGQESKDYYKFFPVVAGEEYQKEFVKQKYYNIKDFKTIYEETKTGGTWYPGMPE